MPIYEYLCSACNIKFEKIQKISSAEYETTNCPNCNNSDQIKKLISSTSFRLKGNGWYETDFKSSNEVKRNLSSNSSCTNNCTSQPAKSPAADPKGN